jgi:hypothetical protein
MAEWDRSVNAAKQNFCWKSHAFCFPAIDRWLQSQLGSSKLQGAGMTTVTHVVIGHHVPDGLWNLDWVEVSHGAPQRFHAKQWLSKAKGCKETVLVLDSSISSDIEYQVKVKTGDSCGAGTDAGVAPKACAYDVQWRRSQACSLLNCALQQNGHALLHASMQMLTWSNRTIHDPSTRLAVRRYCRSL